VSYSALFTADARARDQDRNPVVWIIDSGAALSITGDRSLLDDYNTPKGPPASVRQLNGSRSDAAGFGEANVPLQDCDIVLDGVLHVPGASVNLIAVSRLAKSYGPVVFNANEATFKVGDRTVRVPCSQGVYRLHAIPRIASAMTASDGAALSSEIDALHSSMGHLHLDALKRMVRCGLLSVSPKVAESLKHTTSLDCVECAMGKMSRSSAPKRASKTRYLPGQRMDSDTCGPVPLSVDGYRHIIVFVCAKTGFTNVLFLRKI
jgi:hypothetical protein